MTIEVLRSPLSKGEKNEKEDSRVIEITESGDNRGMKPDVYLAIYKTVGKRQKQVIVEDFFLNTDVARAIGRTIINVANEIDKKAVIADLSKMTKKPISKKEADLIGKTVKKINKNNAKTIEKAGKAVKCVIGEKSKCKVVTKYDGAKALSKKAEHRLGLSAKKATKKSK